MSVSERIVGQLPAICEERAESRMSERQRANMAVPASQASGERMTSSRAIVRAERRQLTARLTGRARWIPIGRPDRTRRSGPRRRMEPGIQGEDADRLRHHRIRDRRDRRRPGRRRGRRRGPGERGRSDLRRRAGHPGTGGVHRPVFLRRDLCRAGRRGLRSTGPAADVQGQPGPQGHRVHGHRGRERWHHHGDLGRRADQDDQAAGRSGRPRRTI